MSDSPAPSPRCYVYAGRRLAEGYLYVPREGDFSAVPAALLEQLGTLNLVMELTLEPGRKLARANPDKVTQALTDAGFFFQPPPPKSPLLGNDRLLR